MSEGPVRPADLMAGADRFNHGDYFEAHEEWEKAWYGTEGEENRFLKGLIQIAVSLHHLESGNLKGARKVMATALRQLPQQAAPSQAIIPGLLDGLPNVARLVARNFENPMRGPQVVETGQSGTRPSDPDEAPQEPRALGGPVARG